MTTIILARHGETEWNREEIFRGRIDVTLNQTGIRQAELLAEYLREAKIEAVYSSPLRRALMTAQPIARYHSLEVEITPALIDIDFGRWQGLSLQQVKAQDTELYELWINNPHEVKIDGGESLAQVRERTMVVVNEAITRFQDTVVLVSHRAVNKVIICALLGLDNSHFWNI
ncbi:MAG: histidine phosphatase family protein, partial [Chloroflexi bacterium]|nr:histidine phosphatase family protein [Chloroflexota bacterium]